MLKTAGGLLPRNTRSLQNGFVTFFDWIDRIYRIFFVLLVRIILLILSKLVRSVTLQADS